MVCTGTTVCTFAVDKYIGTTVCTFTVDEYTNTLLHQTNGRRKDEKKKKRPLLYKVTI